MLSTFLQGWWAGAAKNLNIINSSINFSKSICLFIFLPYQRVKIVKNHPEQNIFAFLKENFWNLERQNLIISLHWKYKHFGTIMGIGIYVHRQKDRKKMSKFNYMSRPADRQSYRIISKLEIQVAFSPSNITLINRNYRSMCFFNSLK